MKLYRIVAMAFIHNDDPKNKTCVNHKDGDVTNCRADNLEWCDYHENLKHSYDELHRPVNIGKGHRKCKLINKLTGEEFICESIAEASRKSCVSETQLRRLDAGECINNTYDFKILN